MFSSNQRAVFELKYLPVSDEIGERYAKALITNVQIQKGYYLKNFEIYRIVNIGDISFLGLITMLTQIDLHASIKETPFMVLPP